MKKFFLFLIAVLLVGCNQESHTSKTLVDDKTSPIVETVPLKDNHLLVEWSLDAMDRGDHDYNTLTHSELVVEPNYDTFKRGDVIYYEMLESEIQKNNTIPSMYLGRVVGLSGETVEIIGGQVYINNKKLDAFYGVATSLGLTKEEYFEQVNPENYDKEQMKEFFNMSMKPIKVEENTIFVLVDTWWRGTDSKDYGLLPLVNVKGKVMGYKE